MSKLRTIKYRGYTDEITIVIFIKKLVLVYLKRNRTSQAKNGYGLVLLFETTGQYMVHSSNEEIFLRTAAANVTPVPESPRRSGKKRLVTDSAIARAP